jgi:hypothetical protein
MHAGVNAATSTRVITKNYIIIILFEIEKIIMKKERQYCHHLKHHHLNWKKHIVCKQAEHVIWSISLLCN